MVLQGKEETMPRKKHRKQKKQKVKIEIPIVFTGTICAYCGEETQLVDDADVYGTSYGGKCWVCWPCGAWVGCHKGTEKALGRVANKELRVAKMKAHEAFDQLWKRKKANAVSVYGRKNARSLAYKWLSKQMGTAPILTHIGMFNLDQCKKVVQICKPYLK